MRVGLPLPMLSFTEKIIQTNFVQGFLRIFRETNDTHRVLAVVPLAWFISHSYYMLQAPQVAHMATRVNIDEGIWLALGGLITLFMFSWSVFSSEFNPSLYVRQGIFIIWTGLTHRWIYGLEALGTPFLTTVSLIALTSYLPFAFWGLRPDQLYIKIKDEINAKKNARPAVVTALAPQKSESDAA